MTTEETVKGEGINFDISRWPIIVVTPVGNVTDQSLIDFMDSYMPFVMRKQERYAVVNDLRQQNNMTVKQRRRLTSLMKENEEFLNKYNAGTALVFTSPALKGILQAVFWIFKPDRPIEVFSDLDKALAWAESKLQ